MQSPVHELEERLGYRFSNHELLTRALTHRSRSSEATGLGNPGDNEQLEFLGDAILGFVVSEALYRQSPSAPEGRLSQAKSHLVSSRHLYACALRLQIGEFLLLGKGEQLSGGRERPTLLADALEAIIAAVHLDGGMDAARTFIEQHILGADPNLELAFENYKSLLQERAQALGFATPTYAIVGTSGPEHAKMFTVEARVNDQYFAQASGSSKKAASQQAAERLIRQLDDGK
jgi:ribonuclease III